MFLSDKKCPWKIPLKETEIYYYDKKVKNIWNPKGNGWRLESSEKVSLVSCPNNLQGFIEELKWRLWNKPLYVKNLDIY